MKVNKKKKEDMPANKPMKSWRSDKKRVVKAKKGDKEVIIHYGDPNMTIKKHNPKNKKSYCKRSGGIKGKNNIFSSNFWSRREWSC